MRKLLTEPNGGFPLTLDNLRWMQDAYSELVKFQVQADLPIGVNKCIMYGLAISHPLGNSFIAHSSGAVYFDGEIYEVDELVTPIDEVNPSFILDIRDEFDVVYESGITLKVHEVRKLKLATENHVDALFNLNDIERREVLLRNKLIAPGTTAYVKMVDVSSHFSTTTGLGISDYWRGWKIDPDVKGRTVVGYDSSDADFDSAEGLKKGGEKRVKLTENESGLVGHNHGVTDDGHEHLHKGFSSSSNGSGGSKSFKSRNYISADPADYGGEKATTGISVNEVSGQGASQSHQNMQPYVVYLGVVKI